MHLIVSPANQQLFGDNDVFQSFGIPMNPADTTAMEERQRQQNDGSSNAGNSSITGSELISYQPGVQQPIDFTDFLNIDDNDLTMNASGSFVKDK